MLKNLTPTHYFIGFALVIILAVGGMAFYSQNAPGNYDTLAQCIADSEAKFYGAFWCPHCQEQKKMFGNSARLLPYVECSTADGQGRTQVCADNDIAGYPTWIFKDGSRQSGVLNFATLAEKTGCALP